jgi:hypothetical protein
MSIKQDRKRHFVAGFIVAAVVSLFFGYIIGVIAAVLAVTGNEVRKHTEDKPATALAEHITVTIAGAIAAVAASVAVSFLWRVAAIIWQVAAT